MGQPFPFTLANLPAGNNPVSDIDANFAVCVRGPATTVVGNVGYWDNTTGTSENAGYPTNPGFGTITALVGLDGSSRLPPVDGSLLLNLPSAPSLTQIRQTVANGPIDNGGLPTFLPSTAVGLSITSQNVSGSAALVCTAANGWNQSSGSQADTVGLSTANLTWSGLTNSTTNYLYVTISGLVLTPGSTILPPIYQQGGAPANTSGQFTFDIGKMQGYLGNGASAPQTNLVFVGEAVTSGGAVASTVAYAYNGYYDSGFTATLPANGTATSASHNLGVQPSQKKVLAENTTGEFGFSIGDQIDTSTGLAANLSSFPGSLNVASTRLVAVLTSGSAGFAALNKSTGASANLTRADWKYKFICTRGW